MREPEAKIDQVIDAARALAAGGRVRDAAALYRVVLKHFPDHPAAMAGLEALPAETGSAAGRDAPQETLRPIIELHGAGRFAEAREKALALTAAYPGSPVLANILGVLALGLQRHGDAAEDFRRALLLKPDFIEAEANLGTLLVQTGQPAEAIVHLERVLAARPGSADLLNSLANAQAALGRHAEAALHLIEAVRIRPDFIEAHFNLGNALATLGRQEEAEAALRHALSINPALPQIHTSLAVLLADRGRASDAADHHLKAAALDPRNASLMAMALHRQDLICRWGDGREASIDVLTNTVAAGGMQVSPGPFVFMTLVDDPLLQRAVAAAEVAKLSVPVSPAPAFAAPLADGRIRIGYFSADFHAHATMYLMARLFELHDRAAFDIHAFSFGPDEEDAMRVRLRESGVQFHDIRLMPPGEAARHARSLGIDIAVDLKGFTREARPKIFLERAAPIQVNYLGYPGTCGSAAWDYILADRVIVPEALENGYAEKIAAMPDSYQVNDDRRAISGRRFSRAECGLPETGFVFCCFNSSYKITPAEFDIWMRLLCAVEGSVLWLLSDAPETVENLRREASSRGVDPSRLVFAGRLAVPEHLARHELADLFLDTFVVNAHTTASDALWAGLPMVAMAGPSFASRVSASLLHAVGLGELVTSSPGDYEALALSLARDPVRLSAMRARLKADPALLPLFDTARYVRNLEKAYAKMMAIRAEGGGPRNFRV